MDVGDRLGLWAVAGCLFEVSLPVGGGGRWRWVRDTDAVTLLEEDVRGAHHHFRFRAEAPGAVAGGADLRFRAGDPGGGERLLRVRVAPERAEGARPVQPST